MRKNVFIVLSPAIMHSELSSIKILFAYVIALRKLQNLKLTLLLVHKSAVNVFAQFIHNCQTKKVNIQNSTDQLLNNVGNYAIA